MASCISPVRGMWRTRSMLRAATKFGNTIPRFLVKRLATLVAGSLAEASPFTWEGFISPLSMADLSLSMRHQAISFGRSTPLLIVHEITPSRARHGWPPARFILVTAVRNMACAATSPLMTRPRAIKYGASLRCRVILHYRSSIRKWRWRPKPGKAASGGR